MTSKQEKAQLAEEQAENVREVDFGAEPFDPIEVVVVGDTPRRELPKKVLRRGVKPVRVEEVGDGDVAEASAEKAPKKERAKKERVKKEPAFDGYFSISNNERLSEVTKILHSACVTQGTDLPAQAKRIAEDFAAGNLEMMEANNKLVGLFNEVSGIA